MRIDGVSATSTPNLSRPAPTGIAQAQPSAPVDSVAVGAAGPARKGGLETSGLFDRKDRQPVDPATISTWSYEAEPRHTLKETFRTPDGRTYVLAESHDTQRDRLREPASYTAAFDAQGQPLWTFRPEGGHLDRFPLKLDNPQVWKIREVLDQGLVVLEGGGRQLCLQPSRDREAQEALDRAARERGTSAPGKEISRREEWVQVGDVRLPVRRPSH